jgi:hypothetical protein
MINSWEQFKFSIIKILIILFYSKFNILYDYIID